MFGFSAEVESNPTRFFDANYIHGLISQDAHILRLHAKSFMSLVFLNALSLVYIQGIQLDFRVFGHNLPEIPASAHVLCLFLGLTIFGFAINSLDIIILARIRYVVIHKLLGTDLTNMATAHLRAHGLWGDLLSRRYIGYSSGPLQNTIFSMFGIVVIIFMAALFLASSASLVALYDFGLHSAKTQGIVWPTIISTSGLVMGAIGILLFFSVQFIPWKYSLPTPPPQSPKQNILNQAEET